MSGTGERFKKIRQELKLSQGDFGEKLGLSSQGVSNVEKEKSFLSLSCLEKLLKLNVNLNYLVGGVGSMFNGENAPAQDFRENVRSVLREEGLID